MEIAQKYNPEYQYRDKGLIYFFDKPVEDYVYVSKPVFKKEDFKQFRICTPNGCTEWQDIK